MKLQPIQIETKRLLLKGLTPEYMSFIFEQYSKNEIKKILGHRNEEEYQKEELKQKKGYAAYNRTFILFLLIEKTTDTIIGRCGLHNWNVEHHRAEIGYHITDEKFKQQGFMSEAVDAILAYGFHQLKLNRIEALVGSSNIPSLKIMEKYRFIQEGLLRKHWLVLDQYEDSILFSKLYQEYINE